MTDQIQQTLETGELAIKVGTVFSKRCQTAAEHSARRVSEAFGDSIKQTAQPPVPFWEWGNQWLSYWTDAAERSVLFWDTLRRRGNVFLERERTGKPPVLHFDYEIVLDARQFDRPVNYALVRIIPPQGVTVDPKRRPYVIIDPRAGHGPGIGGFKDDSQVGVALRGGHPVYFVIFFPEPQPDQTLLDVCAAEQQFVRKVRQLHPDSPKPAIIGNCQGGWAAMMLAASTADDTGPIVINGAPMSYWGGAWTEGEGNNPMRYAGGLLGGSWMASLSADLGNGIFDGAYLVQNFEYLNPANTYWNKYYHVFANADTEPARFLDFERWWGSYFLLNRQEIEWIVQNLFVGNNVWSSSSGGKNFDLREVRSPIVLFASMGDNITPPQQAFNWVADIYSSTDEIKARGQVIVGLLHESVGHLGIFVSGKVAKKEHAQLVSVLKSIEALPPGLYGMQINESRGADGKTEYEVEFIEHRLEEIASRLNRFERKDELAFEAVEKLSEFNQRAYEMFLRPMVQATSNGFTAELGRMLNPLRLERWILSDVNPWLSWLGPAAEWVKLRRHPVEKEQPLRKTEQFFSELVSTSLDFYRDMRDAACESIFFLTYGGMFNFYFSGMRNGKPAESVPAQDPRQSQYVKDALASMTDGGYAAAVSRAGYLLSRKGRAIPLARLEITEELVQEYRDLFPQLDFDQRRLIRGQQEIICQYDPERALNTIPTLLTDPADRNRFVTLLQRLTDDPRFIPEDVSADQFAMLDRIRGMFSNAPDASATPESKTLVSI